jgi:hypothetical protein
VKSNQPTRKLENNNSLDIDLQLMEKGKNKATLSKPEIKLLPALSNSKYSLEYLPQELSPRGPELENK